MELLIVTGLSGAGKSLAMNALEDIGFFCIDNIPAGLMPRLVEFARQGENLLQRVAVVLDVRACRSAGEVKAALDDLDRCGGAYRVLFLDSSDEVLQRRYKETRRVHPLASYEGVSTASAIALERQALRPLLERADFVLDTSLLSPAQHKERICELFLPGEKQGMVVNVVSFGFKYGLPKEADLVLDVRCLPNPFYIPELKPLTGMDEAVAGYVMGFEQSRELLRRIEAMLEYALPLYVKEGKSQLTIAVGCTGGKHRSITFARLLGGFCTERGYHTAVHHRDMERGA